MSNKINYGILVRSIAVPAFGALLYLILILINSFSRTVESWKYYSWKDFALEYGFSFILSAVLLESGVQTSAILNKKFPWEKSFLRRLIIQFLLQNSLVLILIYVFFLLPIPRYFGYDSLLKRQVNVVALIFSLILLGYFAATHFFKIWSNATVHAAKLEKDMALAQLEALRLQIDPHFLFNNLSVLTSLIEENPQDAILYVQRLSTIYRYLLENRKKELVSLEVELNFIVDYLYLYQVKYGAGITLNIEKKIPIGNKKIPPLTLQLLVENCIKHNSFDLQHPLSINIILMPDGTLTVWNNKAEKPSSHSNNIGLENIKNRYALLNYPAPVVEETDSEFAVKLQVISY